MLHGQRLVLLVYLHLTLVVQYNIILIIINSIYTILLFANKQWGYCLTIATPYMAKNLNINYTKENYFVIGCDGGGDRNLYSFPDRTISKFNIVNTATGQMVLWLSFGK